MLELKGRSAEKTVDPEPGLTLLDLALKHDVGWGFSCTRGTCARCRCLIEEGRDRLNEPTEEELDRLEPEELEQGFRLACQALVVRPGRVRAVWGPYF